MNTHSAQARSCVRLKTLRTGGTLAATVDYVRDMKPRLVLLENVAAIEESDKVHGTSNCDELVATFATLGYAVTHVVLDARRHGAAQRRKRWWAIAVRVNEDRGLRISPQHQGDNASAPCGFDLGGDGVQSGPSHWEPHRHRH